MRVGVVSDTHGHVAHATSAALRLAECDVDIVLHCGDIGSTHIIPVFAAWPTHFVFGNVDYDEVGLAHAIRQAGQTCHERFGQITLGETRIALLHGDDGQCLRQAVASQEFDLVCYGHTHKADCRRAGRTIVLNPGALYRASTHTVAIVELPGCTVRFETVAM